MATLDATLDEIIVDNNEDDAPSSEVIAESEVKRVEIAKLIPAISPSNFNAIIIYSDEKVIELGRKPEFRPECIFSDGRISTVHGRVNIICDEGKASSDPTKYSIQFTDLGRNGCFVNGKKLGTNNSVILSEGDTIGLVVPSISHKLSSELPIYTLALCNSTPPPNQQTQELADQEEQRTQEIDDAMANELTCPICSGIFYRPVSVIPCLHNFCSSCLSSWLNPSNNNSYFGQNMNCPTCRATIQEVRKNPTLNNLTETYLKTHPKQDREKEEKEEMDKKDAYINKTDLVLYKRNNNNNDDSDSDSDDDYHRRRRNRRDETSSDESDSDDDTPVRVCDECTNPNPIDNYQCAAHALHNSCSTCNCRLAFRHHDTSLSPDRRQNCELCGMIYCNLYKQVTNTQSPCYISGIHKLKEHTSIISLPSTCLNNNQVERDILIDYIRTKNITVQDVYNTCMTKVESGTYTHPSYPNFTTDSRFCQSCAYKYFNELIYCYRAEIDSADLPATVTSRPTCWYGRDCRTQIHNRGHASRFNHISENTSNNRH
ncbi:predicted protein [Naegleria gruberi]|uniref:E3 ubiquitin-protein ligase CHFR n=1 Tax=Naegleria gruberi TaxID=5762 RepID=D2VH26_NAEGR|nr:uncharacterized protein NAEGRDRAFT_34083 [Naegleria gruberi]EFC43911.1 predicted protein [Naegleria gruberi]|eukprot:XP_002676655.1 predicted protein [Naegleria gruberi strain NEG-M]